MVSGLVPTLPISVIQQETEMRDTDSTLDEIDRWRRREPDTAIIPARADTVPDDIREICAAGVAHRLGRTGVVGCGELVCNEKDKFCH